VQAAAIPELSGVLLILGGTGNAWEVGLRRIDMLL